jgi:hypothetical protein
MRNRSLILASTFFLLLNSACAPGRTITGFTDAAQSRLVPIVQEAFQAITSADQSQPIAATPPALPNRRTGSATARSKTSAPQAAASPVALNGAPLPVTSTAHEDIYVAPGVSNAFLQSVKNDLALAAQDLMQDEGWGGAPCVSIFVFPSHDVWLQGIAQIGKLPQNQVQFQAQLQGDAWLTISGTAHPGVYIYPINQSAFEMVHMLAHEYTHAIQRQVLGDQVLVPDWFIEGMAEAEGWRIAGQTDARSYDAERGQVLTLLRIAARRRNLPPLTSISTQQSWQMRLESPRGATIEYGESQIAIEYLQQIKGQNAPMEILRATAAQHDFQAAFVQVMQLNVPAFQAAFQNTLR